MHVISKRPFNEAAKAHPNQRQALEDLYRTLRNSKFGTPEAMRRVFPSLDNFKHKDKCWVLDVGGNHLRMIAFIQFVQNRMYVKHIVTHAEYDKICKRYAKGELS
ncbi:type II toxin-antitoxin system HigB family toxin [Ectothiorhodospira marina]|uniref:mRNA interferase HigB n=1 Tax=Ectothiorhodospira marina TaxID=1396821 RepID=A0A1H7I806_9GAMM|nr:type II toxin-antitoxin system HigB family toxin [Ectothiorhodospira marina]SEK58636.1 mRNA interferase HigB [Ectothiorhodospira marina]